MEETKTAKHISISINVPAAYAYEFVSDLRNLPKLTNGATRHDDILIDANLGGQIILSGVTQIVDPNAGDATGRSVRINADGLGSLVDLSALQSITDLFPSGDAADGGYSIISATNSGTTRIPALTSAEGLHLSLDNSNTLSISQLTTFTNGIIQVTGGTPQLTSLTNINGTSLDVSGGGTLALPLITSFTHTVGDRVNEIRFKEKTENQKTSNIRVKISMLF